MLISTVIVTKIKVHYSCRQFHKILKTQYFELRELRQTKNELTHEKHQRSAAEQGANNLSDQLKSAGENYAHSQAELGRVKKEKEGVVARLERNKRDLNRKEQQLYEMKVELSGEKQVRAAAEQKANSLSDQLNSARENYAHSQEELRHMKREKDNVSALHSQED